MTEPLTETPSAQSPEAAARRTIPELWRRGATRDDSMPAYLVKQGEAWREVSWREAGERVDALANGLLALGIRKGDRLAILGSTTLEWALFDYAAACVGAVTAAIYANSSPKDCHYILEHSEAIGVLVEDDEQAAKLEGGPELRHVLTFAGLSELAERGRAFAAEHPQALAEAIAAIREDDVFTYIYTSGTTGSPKACMISHLNYYAMVAVADDLHDFTVEGDLMLLFLPLAHNFGRLMHLSGPYIGFTIAFCPDPLEVGDALLAVGPTVFPSVPRVYEKIHTLVQTQFDAATGARRRLIDWSLGVGRRVSALKVAHRPIPASLAAQHRLASRLVYSKVQARLGGRLRVGISGGAPLAKEVAEFFHALDILILEGYGLTECTSAATVNRLDDYRFGTVGPALPGTELRLGEDDELLIRGETVFQGYFKDPEATSAVLDDDGWLHSGDVAAIDADGFVTITDRKKDILITAGGKNVAPANLENLLKNSPYVSHVVVIGDRRPYVTALITLEDDARRLPDIEARIRALVDEVNGELSRYEQIKRFRILSRDFSADEGEITPTLKLKRKVVQENFAAEIDDLYS
ncbi:MAG: AMP-dependent synthetase/ligase [Gaiellaceae bacterium]